MSRWKPGGKPMSASKLNVSCCSRQRLKTHCTGSGRGSSLIVRRASSNHREERCKVALRRELLACQVRSVRCPLPRHAACTHRSEEHTSELQSLRHLVCRLLLDKK